MTQLHTHLETHIGTPKEYLAEKSIPDLSNPGYSTGIGLLIMGIKQFEKEKEKMLLANHLKTTKRDNKQIDKKRKGNEKTKRTFEEMIKETILKLSERFRIWFEDDINESQNNNLNEEETDLPASLELNSNLLSG